MGCERGFVGGLRLSMERRRLANARITSLRYRKYQELRIRLEQAEMRKAAEILERRKKERARLNQYIHSVYQPHVKPQHSLKVQRNRHMGRGEFFKRPPWSTSLIQDQESIVRLRQKEMSVMNAGLVDTRRRDYDPMLQVRVTAQRDAMVDLKACNSRYAIYEIDESKVQETTYSYLHTHLHNDSLDKELQKLEVEKLNIHTTVDEDLLIAEPDVFRDYASKSSKPGLGSRPPKAPTAETEFIRDFAVKSSRMGLGTRPPTSPTPISVKPFLKLSKNTSRSFCLIGDQHFRVAPEVERLSSCEQDMRMLTTSTLPPQISQKEFGYAEAPLTSSNDSRQEKNVSKFSEAPVLPFGLLKHRKTASGQISNEKSVGVVSVGKRAFSAIVPKLILPQTQETESTSSALRHLSDGETASYLTEELFLASLENEAARTRLIQGVTSRLDGCRLIPLDHRNILSTPASDNETGFRPPAQSNEVTTNISAQNENIVREDSKETAERLSKQSHHNSQKTTSNEEVRFEQDHICSNRRPTDSQSNNKMGHCATIGSCPEETSSPVTLDNIIAFKVEGHLQVGRKKDGELKSEGNVQPKSKKQYLEPINVTHDVGNDGIGHGHCQTTNDEQGSIAQLSAPGGICDAGISSISRARSIDNRNRRSPAHVLSPLYSESEHEIEHRMNNLRSFARVPMSSTYVSSNVSPVTDRVEAPVSSGASTTRVVDRQYPSSNSGVLSQSSKPCSRKSEVPCNMQSVYERCSVGSLRPPGYTALRTVNYGDDVKEREGHVQVRPPSAKLASILSHSEDVPTLSPESTFREEINMYHDVSGNKENLGKENCYADMCTPGSEEEMNILASLERLDWKLAAITGRAMNGGRNSLNSQGQCSAKSAQSAPAVLAHEKPSSTTLGQVGLVCGKPKNCAFMNASRPSSAKLPPQKPPRGFRQRQVVGVTNKCHGKVHQLYPKSQGNIPPVTVFPDPKFEARPPSTPGSIVCYKDPHYLLNPLDPL